MIASRLDMARDQGAEIIDFNNEDPVEAIRELTAGIGVDRAIDAVGVDAARPIAGRPRSSSRASANSSMPRSTRVAPEQSPHGRNWHPGDAPSLALQWAVEALCKAGTLVDHRRVPRPSTPSRSASR